MFPQPSPQFMRLALVVVCISIAVQGSVLAAFGQPLISTEGFVKLWEGSVASSGNSQHLTDWYTFSHIIHGFLFFYFFSWLFSRLFGTRRALFVLGAALFLEIGWEILENTPMVIEHYRQQALAAGYVGDSIVNSLSDTLSMVVGFWVASHFRVRYILVTIALFECFTAFMIRDNLTLNVLNLIYPSQIVHEWQSGK